MFSTSPEWAEEPFSMWLETSFLSVSFSEVADFISTADCNVDIVNYLLKQEELQKARFLAKAHSVKHFSPEIKKMHFFLQRVMTSSQEI